MTLTTSIGGRFPAATVTRFSAIVIVGRDHLAATYAARDKSAGQCRTTTWDARISRAVCCHLVLISFIGFPVNVSWKSILVQYHPLLPMVDNAPLAVGFSGQPQTDAPGPDEIIVALAAADGGRAHARIADRFQDIAEMEAEVTN